MRLRPEILAMAYRVLPVALALASVLIHLNSSVATSNPREHAMQFQGPDAALERAIAADDPMGVEAALKAGARVEAFGAHGVTPLIYAVGTGKLRAVEVLLRHGADTAAADAGGDTAVTLAVTGRKRFPDLLPMILKAGGNPNSRMPNGEPVLTVLSLARDREGLRLLKDAGADVDLRGRDGRPLIVGAGLGQDWDIVWLLIRLGAKFDYPDEPNNLVTAFNVPGAIPDDSPLWPAKEKVWTFLKEHGLPVPPLHRDIP